MNLGDAIAWLATGLYPATAAAGVVFRRLFSGALARRLRPHFILGYVVLGLGLVHAGFAMPAMGSLNATSAWLATTAIAGLGVQTFLGMSLQAPGVYRTPLRRWHLVTMCAAGAAIAGHVALTL